MNISTCLTVQLAHTVVIKAKCDAFFFGLKTKWCVFLCKHQIQFILEYPVSLFHILVIQSYKGGWRYIISTLEFDVKTGDNVGY